MSEQIEVSGLLGASPAKIYVAWLSSAGHSAMTGSPAETTYQAGGRFTAWDGYISGQNLQLEPNKRIIQAWRTSEFPAGAPDSRLEVVLEAVGDGTRITFRHSNIPAGQGASYEKGWHEFYLAPMAKYFGAPAPAKPAPAKAAPAKAVEKKPAAKKPEPEKKPAAKKPEPEKKPAVKKPEPDKKKPAAKKPAKRR